MKASPSAPVPQFVGYALQGGGEGKMGSITKCFKYLCGGKILPNTNRSVVYLAASASCRAPRGYGAVSARGPSRRGCRTTLLPYAYSLREGWSEGGLDGGVAVGCIRVFIRCGRGRIPYTMVQVRDV